MSWQEYIDEQLLAAGFMYATINGLAGELWASSKDFVVGPEEIQLLSSALSGEDEGLISKLASSGFAIAGQKYTFTRSEIDDDEQLPYIHGRCKEEGKSSQGVIIVKTNQALVLGVHDPAYSGGISFGGANTAISKVADHISNAGY